MNTTVLVALGISAFLAHAAVAQLTPDRLYYGVNRAIPMTIDPAQGDVEIALFAPAAPGSAADKAPEPIEKVAAAPGRVDLAGLFPILWTSQKPTLYYAQVLVGGAKVGAPVVLQPLLNPEYALGLNPDNTIRWSGGDKTFSGIRAYVDKRVVLDTTLGEVEIALRPDVAPNTAFTFRSLVDGGFYTDVVFHRIVPVLADGNAFVVQAGDPAGKGSGGPGFMFDLERSSLPHDFGVISMARTNDPNTNGSQFFLCLSRQGTARLDGLYTAFGQTVRGAETILAIASVPLADERLGQPVNPPIIKSARLINAPPFGEGPKPVTRDSASNPAR